MTVLLKKVMICLVIFSMLSVVLMILYTGSDSKTARKIPGSFWGAVPLSLIRTFMNIGYDCKHRLLVKQTESTMWEICRDMDQGINLDTPRHTDCQVVVATSSYKKTDKKLIGSLRSVFDRCEISELDIGEGRQDLLNHLTNYLFEKNDVELLKMDITNYNWLDFEDVLQSDVLDNVRQLLLRIDMADVDDKNQNEKTTGASKISGFEQKYNLLQNLEILGFSLTFSNYIPHTKEEGRKSLCCYYGTWVKLREETDSLTEENSEVLDWQPSTHVFADGHNETFQTPFQLQPWVGGSKENNSPDWDSEVQRLLRYIRNNQLHCKQAHHVGHDRDDDGGWDVCFEPEKGLNSTKCLVYSVGIGDDWSFDEAMAAYGCDVFAFDPSIHQPSHKHSERVWFHNFGLLDKNSDTHYGRGMVATNVDKWKVRTLEGLMAEIGHQHQKIDILKIDIEGSEWQVLYQMLERGTLQYVKQLIFEMHLWKPKFGEERESFRKKYSILKWLEEQGFRMWHWHENVNSLQVKLGYNYFFSEPCCYEVAWTNTRFHDWWHSEPKKYQRTKI